METDGDNDEQRKNKRINSVADATEIDCIILF